MSSAASEAKPGAQAQRWIVMLEDGRVERPEVREVDGRWHVVGATNPSSASRATPRAAVMRHAVERGWPVVAIVEERAVGVPTTGPGSPVLPTAHQVVAALRSCDPLWLVACTTGETRHFRVSLAAAYRNVDGMPVSEEWLRTFTRDGGSFRFTQAVGDDPFAVTSLPDDAVGEVTALVNRHQLATAYGDGAFGLARSAATAKRGGVGT